MSELPELMPWLCVRCGEELPPDFPDACGAPDAREIQTHPSGAFMNEHGACYCAGCAPTVAVCRICGCTDEAGCAGGCSWVEPDLCSECHRRRRKD